MRATQQRGSFLAWTILISPCLATNVCGAFSNRVLSSSLISNKSSDSSLYCLILGVGNGVQKVQHCFGLRTYLYFFLNCPFKYFSYFFFFQSFVFFLNFRKCMSFRDISTLYAARFLHILWSCLNSVWGVWAIKIKVTKGFFLD